MKHWRNATVALATLAFAAPAAAAPTVTEFEIPTADSKPWDIVLDPDGKLWFTENAFGADKIGRVTPGNPPVIDEFAVPTGFATPLDITVGPDHQIWFNGQCNGAGGVGRINPLDPTDKECHGGFGVTGGARGIAGGSDGSIWLGDPGNHRVLRIDPATGNLRATAGDIDLGNTFTGIKNITPGPDGNAWVTEFSGQIARVTRTGSSTPFPVTATTAWDIVSGPDGNLWYTAPNGAAAVAGRMTTAGTANEFPVTSASDPHGIAVGFDGALWIAQAIANSIGHMTTSGQFTEVEGLTAASRPENISPGPDNTVWFTEQDGNRIGRITGIELPGGGGNAPPPPPAPPPDTTRPNVTKFAITRKVFRVGGLGTVVKFTLSESATVTIRFARLVDGRFRQLRRKMRFQSTAGANRFRFRGRFDLKHPLKPGRYRMTLRARDAAGNVSAPDRVRFRLLRRR